MQRVTKDIKLVYMYPDDAITHGANLRNHVHTMLPEKPEPLSNRNLACTKRENSWVQAAHYTAKSHQCITVASVIQAFKALSFDDRIIAPVLHVYMKQEMVRSPLIVNMRQACYSLYNASWTFNRHEARAII